MKKFTENQKVRENRQGAEVWTVMKQVGSTVYIYELCGRAVHASKLVEVA